MEISVTDFSAPNALMILKFGTKLKLDSDELYCVTKNSHILLISLFICSLSFSLEILSQISQLLLEPVFFKFCVHLQIGKAYCVNEN